MYVFICVFIYLHTNILIYRFFALESDICIKKKIFDCVFGREENRDSFLNVMLYKKCKHITPLYKNFCFDMTKIYTVFISDEEWILPLNIIVKEIYVQTCLYDPTYVNNPIMFVISFMV